MSARPGREVVTNAHGDRSTPTCVVLTPKDGSSKKGGVEIESKFDFVVGNVASHIARHHPKTSARGPRFLRAIGRDATDPYLHAKLGKLSGTDTLSLVLNDKGLGNSVALDVDGITVPSSFFLTRVVSSLLATAGDATGDSTRRAVVAVSSTVMCSPKRILAFRKACLKAGLMCTHICSEAILACLPYDLDRPTDGERADETIVVFVVGGHSLRMTVIQSVNGSFRVLGTLCDYTVGGFAFDDALYEHVKRAMTTARSTTTTIPLSSKICRRLRSACMTAKKKMSARGATQTNVYIEGGRVADGADFNYKLSRLKVESIFTPIVETCVGRMRQFVRQFLGSDVEPNHVVLAGAAMLIPKLNHRVRYEFRASNVLNNVAPDEVIALGASTQAAFLDENTSDDLWKRLDNFGVPDRTCGNVVVYAGHSIVASVAEACCATIELDLACESVLEFAENDVLLARFDLRSPGDTSAHRVAVQINMQPKQQIDVHIRWNDATRKRYVIDRAASRSDRSSSKTNDDFLEDLGDMGLD